MHNILFFTYGRGTLEKPYAELAKILYPEYNCDVWHWTHNLTADTAALLAKKYDVIVTNPAGAHTLNTAFEFPYSRVVCINGTHNDVLEMLITGKMASYDFDALLGYAVLCPAHVDVSIACGVERAPEVLPIGVMTQNYARPAPCELNKIGYFTAPSARPFTLPKLAAQPELSVYDDDAAGIDISRGYLAKRVAELTGVELVVRPDIPFFVSEQLYHGVDLVMFCSLTDALPLAALEAVAAGLPVLGTNTGVFPALAASGAGGVLPFDPSKFIAEAVEVVNALRSTPALFQQMCAAARAEGTKHDWSRVKPVWLDYFRSLQYTG